MTRPTQRLDWVADPLDSKAVRCKWYGAGWHYTLVWGDGASERVLFWQPPVKHAYPTVGNYTIVARSDLHEDYTASVVVTLRDYLRPPLSVQLVEGTRNRVRLTLPHVAEPVRFEVDWGDGQVTEHGASDTDPEHEYPDNFAGRPTILVRDMPARRTNSIVGPDMPEPPPPESDARMQFRTTKGKPDWTGVLELFGFPPRTTVDLGPAGNRNMTPPGTVTTDGNGYASREYTLLDDTWQFDDWWQVYARWTDPTTKRWRQKFLPIQWCEYAGGPYDDPTQLGPCWKPVISGKGTARNPCNEFPLLVDWDIAAPQVITLYTATPGPIGDWNVDWGNGVTQSAPAANGLLRVTHDYGQIKNVWVTVTRPDGRVARRRLRQMEPRFETWTDGSLAIFWQYEQHINEPPCALKDCDPYTVVRIDAGDGRPLQQRARPSLHCPDRSGNGISYGAPGEYRIAVYAPMSATRYGTHVQKTRGIGEGEFEIKADEPAPNPLSQTFHVGNIAQPGRYTAQFRITNNSDRPVPWLLEFTLAPPAVLADVQSWVGTATKHDLGDGRWRVTCDQPARARDPFPVEITVDPCGNPRMWPADVRLEPAPTDPQSTPDSNESHTDD